MIKFNPAFCFLFITILIGESCFSKKEFSVNPSEIKTLVIGFTFSDGTSRTDYNKSFYDRELIEELCSLINQASPYVNRHRTFTKYILRVTLISEDGKKTCIHFRATEDPYGLADVYSGCFEGWLLWRIRNDDLLSFFSQIFKNNPDVPWGKV